MNRPRELLHISDEHFCAFGRILHAFARTEIIFEGAIRNLINMSPEQAAFMFSQYSYNQKRSLFQSIIGQVAAPKDEQQELLNLIRRIDKRASLRNNIAHSVWAKGRKPNSIKPFVIATRGALKIHGSGHNEKEWTATELHKEADFILERLSEIVSFLTKRDLFP